MPPRPKLKLRFRRGLRSSCAVRWLFVIVCTTTFFISVSIHKTSPDQSVKMNYFPVSSNATEATAKTSKDITHTATVGSSTKNISHTVTVASPIKDVFHIVTAASSKEFEPLLKLIYSLTTTKISIALWLWSLDLSSCEISYIESLKTPFRISIEQFPYHVYPLHIRQYHLLAIKPVALDIASLTFGFAMWIDPNSVVTGNMLAMIGKLSETGYIIDPGETNAIGISYYKYEDFRKRWIDCVKTPSCIKKYSKEGNNRETDPVLRYMMSQKQMKFTSFEGIIGQGSSRDDFSIYLDEWKNSASTSCSKHEVCILSGNHESHRCLTPLLGTLRKNKVRYASKYGYRYIEETYGFHKFGPCNPNWNKVQAILKNLPDCKMLLWVDSDCIFTNINKTIESHFEKYPDKELLMNWPKTDKMLNSGVILIKNTKSTRDFFHNVTTGENWTENWCNGRKRDQGGIKDQVNAGYLKDKLVVERNDYFLQGLCGLKDGKCFWHENDFIAHFAPPSCPELPDFIKDFFDKYPQFAS